jgi:hypothetical protein
MVEVRSSLILRTIPIVLVVCLLSVPAHAKYSGGTGEPNDPYQIATVADLIALGETPEDYDKYFILTADIDLDPNLPGGKVFDRAVIAPDIDPTQDAFQGMAFTGVFDGDGHAISHLRIRGAGCVGLFGCIESPAWVGDLGMVDLDVHGSGGIVGGLVGENFHGTIVSSYSTGSVNGTDTVGGLVGNNDAGRIDTSSSSGSITGKYGVGGLVGWNLWPGTINASWSSGLVNGFGEVGGLVGYNGGFITNSYSRDSVSGTDAVGGFAGRNVSGSISASYSRGSVSGNQLVGGLVGRDTYGNIGSSFWDIQTSGQTTSAGGTGKTTAEMQTAKTFLDAGWDFVGETANGTEDIWRIDEGKDYPRLSWEPRKYSGGTGEPNDPYQIATAADLIALGNEPNDYDKHFVLTADIDLDPNLPGRKAFDKAVIGQVKVVEDPNSLSVVGAPFAGVFDGNDHTISHLTITSGACVGLFGCLDSGAEVRNLAVVDVNITTWGDYVGSLVGCNFGRVAKCHGTSTLSGRYYVGGLVGLNYSGMLTACSSISAVSGVDRVGGLVGHNGTQYRYDRPRGSVTQCYSAGRVTGTRWGAGGLAGSSDAAVTQCYSTSEVSGGIVVGGLVGCNYMTVTQCYSTGSVTGNDMVGGLTGLLGTVEASFWDLLTSGQSTSAGGEGKTTAQMQTARTFLDAGWDFIGETANGAEDVWWIDEGKDYPRLWWEQK